MAHHSIHTGSSPNYASLNSLPRVITTPQAHSSYYQMAQFDPHPGQIGQPGQVGLVQPVQFYQPGKQVQFYQPGQPATLGHSGQLLGHQTLLPHAFHAMPLQDTVSGNWNMDTGASSHLNDSVTSLSDVLNMCIYSSVSVGDGHSIPVTNSGHSVLTTPHRPLHLNNVLITPNIVKNVISVRQFVRDNNCTVEFDVFGFSFKDFMTRRILLWCDNTGDLYQVTKPSTLPHAFLTSQYTWHQRLGHQGVRCYNVFFLVIQLRALKRNIPFFVMLVSLANT
ncbi:hypothetical protein Tco_0961901 [Tanacetum coccineum]